MSTLGMKMQKKYFSNLINLDGSSVNNKDRAIHHFVTPNLHKDAFLVPKWR